MSETDLDNTSASEEPRLDEEKATQYEPVQTRQRTHNKTPSHASREPSITSIGRVRSHNGYGVEDLDGSQEGSSAADEDPFEVRWESDEEPLCPRSMSIVHKWAIVIIVGMCSLCVTCASSIYTGTYEQMNQEFGSSNIVETVGLSTFVLGIALGPLLMSPLSEFYGRRPIYLISWSMFLVWLIPSAVARNIQTILMVRFLDGFSGSAFLSVAGGTVADIFRRDEIQAPMAITSLSPFVGPSIGPLLGGFINANTNWRWTYYVQIIWAFVLFIAIITLCPETYHPIKLREKARKLRSETGDDRWKAPMEKTNKSIARAVGLSLLRPFQLLVFETMVLLLCLLSAILLGILYLFFGAFHAIFGDVYGFNLWQTGLAFLGILTGMILSTATDPIWQRVYNGLVLRNGGQPEPEYRLPPTIAGSILVPIGLFWFGWSAYPWVHWMVPVVGSGIFGMGTMLVFTGIWTFLVDAYPLYAASALAANAFARCLFAAAFPLFGIYMYDGLGYQWGSSLLAFLTLAMVPFPYLFFRYGKRLRKNSRFANST